MRTFRISGLGWAAVILAASLAACGDEGTSDCGEGSAAQNGVMAAAFAAPTPTRARTTTRQPAPTVARTTAKTTTLPTTPATIRTTTSAVPPRTVVTTPTAKPTYNVTPVKPGKVQRKIKGETAYYPVPLVVQPYGDIIAAQDAIRWQILTEGRFTKSTRHYSPVMQRWYVYHSDDDYTAGVPQDLYDPFDPRNWTQPLSPFYLNGFVVPGYAMDSTSNPLNGDYLDDEGYEEAPAPNSEEPDC